MVFIFCRLIFHFVTLNLTYNLFYIIDWYDKKNKIFLLILKKIETLTTNISFYKVKVVIII